MRYGLILLFPLVATACLAQTPQTGQAKTNGSCSPAISGNNNQFKITCEGIDKEQAQALLRILNTILSKQLDANAVMEKLDEIQRGIGEIKDRQGWSELSRPQIKTLCADLKIPVKQKVKIMVPNADENRLSLAKQLREGFLCAQWDADVGTMMVFPAANAPIPFGIEIHVKEETAPADGLGNALLSLFGQGAVKGIKEANMTDEFIQINVWYRAR